jgi:hypothetical protein
LTIAESLIFKGFPESQRHHAGATDASPEKPKINWLRSLNGAGSAKKSPVKKIFGSGSNPPF